MPWTYMAIAGRALMALLFILAGVAKILGPKPFLAHMAEHRVPAFLLPAVIALELVGGLSVLTGIYGRWGALALAVFCVLTAVIFHLDWSDKAERTLCLKDIALAGGLLALAAQLGSTAGA